MSNAGTRHWRMQRLTAIVLLPLSLWATWALATHTGATHTDVVAWLKSPLNAGLLLAFLIAAFYHMALGVQVVLEDYMHADRQASAALIAVWLEIALLALTMFALLKISLS